jgi:predicted nuclease of predicted toxin-antitoxin system
VKHVGAPLDPTFVLDENMAGSIVTRIQEAGFPVKAFVDLFDRGLTDEILLEKIATRPDLFLITKDSDFRYKPAVKKALLAHRVGVFIITSGGNKSGVMLADLIISAWPRLVKFARKHPRPFVARITSDSHVVLHS